MLRCAVELMAGYQYMAAAPVQYAYPTAPQAYASTVKYVNPYAAAASSRSAVFTDRHAVSELVCGHFCHLRCVLFGLSSSKTADLKS